MDSDKPGRSDDEFTPDSTLNDCTSDSYGGAVFSGCKKFTVAGGTFTHITKNITNSLDTPSDFRMVPLGDIDLQREIQLDSHSGIVDSRKERGSVRRVYSAKTTGRKSRVTVAVYEGEGGAEEWRQHVAKYMSVRHPHIIQICGVAASSGSIHAILFYNELILFDHFLDRYRHSPILTVYIYKSCTTQYSEAFQYLSTLYRHLWQPSKLTIWVRQSSGHLSVDLVPSGTPLPRFALYLADKNFQRIPFLNKPNREAEAISLLTLDQYHEICVIQYRFLNFISHARKTVSVGALIAIPCQQAQNMVPIATLPDTLSPGRWKFAQDVEEQGVVLGDGWTRYKASSVFGKDLVLSRGSVKPGPWISQANHILGRLGITSNLDKYMVVHNVAFWVKVSPPDHALEPEGFLFLAPVIDFQTGPSTFTWPQRFPAYWSLDPEGVNILSMDEATQLLWFPSIKLSMQITGYSWDDRIYAGLRQFHQAKGFEPDSQDIARHLGQPLYQLVNEIDAPFAHGVNGAEDSHSVPTEEEFEEFLQRQSVEAEEAEPPHYSEETVPTSGTFRFFINARLALILFLALLKIYDTVHA